MDKTVDVVSIDTCMEHDAQARRRLGRQDWIDAALDTLFERGVSGVKVLTIAQNIGVTTGSFYWHFNNLRDLLDAVLDHWEHHLTDHIIRDAREFDGAPEERIYGLMEQVIEEGAAEPDHAISVWSKSDPEVAEIFTRTVQRRFEFAAWMFGEAGFAPDAAQVRGRMMVAYLMGESSSGLKSNANWQQVLREHWTFLVSKTNE